MRTYIFICGEELYLPNMKVNRRGFYEYEINEILRKQEYQNAKVLCIEEELEKFHLYDSATECDLFDEEVYAFKLWYDAYMDNNINGFSLPITVKTNYEYRSVLEKKLKAYAEYLKRPAFVYEDELCDSVEEECKLILEALDNLIVGKEYLGDGIISQMLELFKEDPFLIGELDKSYSFRGVAPFIELHVDGYEQEYGRMLDKELTFYRVRTKSKDDHEKIISDVPDILHLPYKMKDKAGSMRFSSAGLPGLYLGTTTYICSKECNWNRESEDLYASVFIPNEEGKKLKILNLTISQALINGICNRYHDDSNGRRRKLQISMLKIFPLVIATSFSVNSEEKSKNQYLLSQALMRVASKSGIDGIAYLSMKGEDEFQYPQGVNLAIPAIDISDINQYSSKCKGFKVSKPITYCEQERTGRKSYINEMFAKYDANGCESFTAKLYVDGQLQFYEDTYYGKFDNYLVAELLSNINSRDEFSG